MKEPKYPLSDDDKFLVEEVLGLAQRTVDLQYDDETNADLQQMVLDMAELFGIVSQDVHVEVAQDGTITAKIVEDEQPLPDTRAGIKLVSDNGERVVEFRKKTPLPPGLTLTPDNSNEFKPDQPKVDREFKPDKPRSGPAPENEE